MKWLTKSLVVLALFVLVITGVRSSAIGNHERHLSPDKQQVPLPSWESYYVQYVEPFGYPDDVGGAYVDETNTTCYLVVDPTPERIKELQIKYGENVKFIPCKYSYTELMKVNYEIICRMESDENIRFISVGPMGWDGEMNCVEVGVYEDQLAYYRTEFAKQYGDKVYVEKVSGVPTLV